MLEPPFETAAFSWVRGTEEFRVAEAFALTIDPSAPAHIVYIQPKLKVVMSNIVESRVTSGRLRLARLTMKCSHGLIVEAQPRVHWYDLHESLAMALAQKASRVPSLAAFVARGDGGVAIVEAYYNAIGIKSWSDYNQPKKRGRPKKVVVQQGDVTPDWRKYPGWYLGLREPDPEDEWGAGCQFVMRLG